MKIKSDFLAASLLVVAAARLWGQQPGTNWVVTTGNPVYASPAVGPDLAIYLGSTDNKLYALKPDGTTNWIFTAGGYIGSSPSLGPDGTVYFGAADNKLYAVNPGGTLKWTFKAGNWIYSSPTIGADGTIYVGAYDHNIYAINAANGSQKWAFATGNEIYSSAALGGDGTLYCGSRDRKLYALNSADGSLKWAAKAGGSIDSSPAIGEDGVIYVGSDDGKLYAFDPANGATNWTFSTASRVATSPCLGPDGTIYFGSSDGRVYALNPNGSKLWSFLTDGGIAYSSPALAADGTVYIGSLDGRLYAINAGGTKKWDITTGNKISYCSPAVGPDGTIYIGSDDSKLYAIPGSSPSASGPWPMFHRDLRRAGSGLVERGLPQGYSPGMKIWVTLLVTPPADAAVYVVEDQPPAGWSVDPDSLGDSGYYDGVNRKVKFEVFYDPAPRVLTYAVTPPMGESGLKIFNGWFSADNFDSFTGGDTYILPVPAHPADNEPVDNRLTVDEITTYDAAWQLGQTWPIGPSPVPSTYLTRAIALWRGGEFYSNNTNVPAPFGWTNTSAPLSATLDATNLVAPGTGNCTAVADMPEGYVLGGSLTVAIAVSPSATNTAYAVEDRPPGGWTVSQVSGDGVFDAATGKVKWGPFLSNLPRTLSYQVSPPATARGTVEFIGTASFDGVNQGIDGQRQTVLNGVSAPLGTRQLPEDYSPGLTFTVTLHITPPANAAAYLVEDQPPAGWSVGTISEQGVYNSSSRKVVFGPFFDTAPVDLTYEATPPSGQTNTAVFSGFVYVDDYASFVGGDRALEFAPVQPADMNPSDDFITIGELTAYGAAWKQGGSWPAPPAAIPFDYLTNAISLWRGGEFYRYNAQITNAPLYWVNASPPIGQVFPQPATLATNSGTAEASLPAGYQIGKTMTVVIAVAPLTNTSVYAVEEQPPAGWSATGISNGGQWDVVSQKIKWGPFFDSVPRTLSYQASPPPGASGMVNFSGTASFDGADVAVTGQRQSTLNGTAVPMGTRQLPVVYSPSLTFTVTLHVAPPGNISAYLVEEQPPAGWTVGAASQGGSYNPATGKVVFGPFTDTTPSDLTYEVTPSPGQTNEVVFSGFVYADDFAGLIAGDRTLESAPSHPADLNPVDALLTIGEVTAFGAAWRQGGAWPAGPSPIPFNYLTNAIGLWRAGEEYRYDTNITNAPYYWVSARVASTNTIILPLPGATNAGTAVATQTGGYPAGEPVTVTIVVTPLTNTSIYALEEQPPMGWQVATNLISHDGWWDKLTRKIKWGPFFDNVPRVLSYQASPPAGVGGVAIFAGIASFDGVNTSVTGQRQIDFGGGGMPVTTGYGAAYSTLPLTYVLGQPMQVSLEVLPATNTATYSVEDHLPDNFDMVLPNQDTNAVWDSMTRTVRFGPFNGHDPQTLVYYVMPTNNAGGLATFSGIAIFDGTPVAIAGQRQTIPEPIALDTTLAGSRQLPEDYLPGVTVAVTNLITPPATAGFYVVEDRPPAGWIVGNISDGGRYDPVSRSVKFDNLFGPVPRTLSYVIIPPPWETNQVLFDGLISAGGMVNHIGGDSSLALALLHPADNNPMDRRLTIAEVTAYDAAWKLGRRWTNGVAGSYITADYLTRAVDLWQNGEFYSYNAGISNAPLFWVNTAFPRNTNSGVLYLYPQGASNCTATATLAASGGAFKVTLLVTPATSTVAYAVEDQPPAGWTVSLVSDDGVWDGMNQKVKWGPFFGNTRRTLTYSVTPPADNTGPELFSGTAAFDNLAMTITGPQRIPSGGTGSLSLAVLQFSPALGFQLELTGPANQTQEIQVSTNLEKWSSLLIVTNLTGSMQFTDPAARDFPYRFYRARIPGSQ